MKLIAIMAGLSATSGVIGLMTGKRMSGYALAGTVSALIVASVGIALFVARGGGNDNIAGALVLYVYLLPAIAGFAIGATISKIRSY